MTAQTQLRALRRAFSLTELLVVIGIIVLLVGLLLVALGGVRDRAKATDTLGVMQSFRQAAEAFQLDHRAYPGVIPETVLDNSPGLISSTENALLHMMGGYRLLTPASSAQEQTEFNNYNANGGEEINFGGGWRLSINLRRIGEGPIVNGKPFGAYFTPSGREFAIVEGQVEGGPSPLPDLIDSWGQPILYVRRLRTIGPLAGDANGNPPPQFATAGLEPYLNSTALGELGKSQVASGGVGSVLTLGSAAQQAAMLGQAIRHPAFGPANNPLDVSANALGAVALISAGPDGVFFGRDDGPGSPGALIGGPGGVSEPDFFDFGPTVFDEFDDIRVFGGG
ncbi:MAG: hypothetical protein ACYTGC_06645 [Planctomycetota bacterium]